MLENILVIGLGSMGKRRIRNLQFIGYKSIAGFDPREDRRAEANEKYQMIHSILLKQLYQFISLGY